MSGHKDDGDLQKFQALPSVIVSLGKELSDKPLSMLSALRAMFDPRSVALKEYLPAMKDTVGSSGSFSWAQ